MAKRSAENAGGVQFDVNHPSTFIEAGKEIVRPPDEFATKVSCDIFKYLSMKGFYTYFVDIRDVVSFRALYCKPLGFSVVVKENDVATSGHMVHFFLNDATRNNPLVYTDEQPWRVMESGGEVCNIEPLVSLDDEMKVRAVASNAYNALKSAFSRKAEAELHEFHFQFGRPTVGHWAGKLVLTGVITSNECCITWGGSVAEFERNDFYLAMLTEKLFS